LSAVICRKSTDGERVLLGNDLWCHNFKRQRTNKENNHWTKSQVQESKNQWSGRFASCSRPRIIFIIIFSNILSVINPYYFKRRKKNKNLHYFKRRKKNKNLHYFKRRKKNKNFQLDTNRYILLKK
jgi:hypothetical protein